MPRLMVVEDDPMSALVVERVLTRMGGHQVVVCDDGDRILQQARSGLVDMIIMDVSLSNTHYAGECVDGLTLCQLLKQDEQTARLPVLLVTAHAMRGDRETFLARSGADEYISKPIVDHEAFCRLISAMLDHGKTTLPA